MLFVLKCERYRISGSGEQVRMVHTESEFSKKDKIRLGKKEGKCS